MENPVGVHAVSMRENTNEQRVHRSISGPRTNQPDSRGGCPGEDRATPRDCITSMCATRMTSAVTSPASIRDHHEAEDITQNVFAKLMKAIKKYESARFPSTPGSCGSPATRRSTTCGPSARSRPRKSGSPTPAAPRPPRPWPSPAPGAGRPARGSARGTRAAAHRRPLAGGDRRHPRQERELGARPSPSRPAFAAGQPDRARRGAGGRRPAAGLVSRGVPGLADSRSSRMRSVTRPASSSAAK